MRISVTDALDAMERNIKAFLVIAGEKPGRITAFIDSQSGTASIKHERCPYTGAIHCEIRFPALASTVYLEKTELDRWTGYFIHELCHALYTIEEAWKAAVAERIHVLVNAMEDVRIETKFNQAAIAANSTALLNSLLAWCVSELPSNWNPNDMKDFPWLLAMAGRVHVCGYALPDAETHLAKLSPALAALVSEVMEDVRHAQDTWDIVTIARGLKTRLAPKPKTNPGKSKPEESDVQPGESEESDVQPGDGESDVQPGKTEKPGAAKVDEKSETTGAEESDVQPEGDNGKAGKGGQGKGESEDKPEEEELQADVDSMRPVNLDPVSDAVKDAAKETKKNYADALHESRIVQHIRKAQAQAGKPLPSMGDVQFRNMTDAVQRLNGDAMKAGKMKAQAAKVLKAADNETYERNRPSGRIDRHAMARIGAGQTEGVYARRTYSSGYQTEITVLIDHSGSMAGTSAWTASTLALVIAQAAQMVGVRCDVVEFNSESFQTIKAVNETASASMVQKRLARLGITSGGSTPLTESMIHCAAKLAARAPNKRKMLFVVSDGDCDQGDRMVRKACDYAKRRDIETVALCIDVPVHGGFDLGVTCSSRNVAQAGLGVLVRALERDC